MSACGMSMTNEVGTLECILDESHLEADNPSMFHEDVNGEVWSAFFDKR